MTAIGFQTKPAQAGSGPGRPAMRRFDYIYVGGDALAKEQAAVRIQSEMRKMQARKEVEERREARRRELAATHIQSKQRQKNASLDVQDMKARNSFQEEAMRVYVRVDINDDWSVSYMELAEAMHVSPPYRSVVSMVYSDRNAVLEGMRNADEDGSGNFSWGEFSEFCETMMVDIQARKKGGLQVSYGCTLKAVVCAACSPLLTLLNY